MKNLALLFILSLGLMFHTQSSMAQQEYQPVIELKAAPLKAATGILNLGAEFVINERIGIEPILDFGGGVIFDNRKIGTRVFGKFYIDPKMGADRLYAGTYVKYRYTENYLGFTDESHSKLALGFLFGYKYVAKNGFVFDAGYGLGQVIAARTWDPNIPGSPNASTTSQSGGVFRLDAVAQLSIGYRFGTINDPVEFDSGKLNRKPKNISDRRMKR